ncbi:uncharacterized protein LOC100371769 [Saccoglossus kowalevskii]|uniref:Uncharacterized protein LOC100371769 n=1 Tax=Saccoglossus kowalevskii TaxID=10224 RepID=A0A0U2L5V4_SACKO|nr:PREDICTED: uncharacterized protein LOC100371769 [Saccoglossus kowalevskii]ALR88617.1 von Willebrand type d domain protein-like m10 [Saccoglossus kowalevskii]
MGQLFLFLTAFCIFAAIHSNEVNGKVIVTRTEVPTEEDGEPVLIIPLDELLKTYDVNATGVGKRQLDLIPLPAGTVIAYVIFATCEYISFWAMDITMKFKEGWLETRHYTDPNDIPGWSKISQNPWFSFSGVPTFTITLGPFDPCTKCHIDSKLQSIEGFQRLGNFTISTDCPCDPGSGQGDPHYVTFDKNHLEFNGPCSYVLTETCVASDFDLKVISTHGEVISRFVNNDVRRIESAKVTTGAHVLDLRDNGVIMLNGVLVTTSVLTQDALVGVQIVSNGTDIIFSASGKWWIEWSKNARNNRNRLFVGIHKDSDLIGKVCGMLGHKQPEDYVHIEGKLPYLLANGSFTDNAQELGHSWEVPGSCP